MSGEQAEDSPEDSWATVAAAGGLTDDVARELADAAGHGALGCEVATLKLAGSEALTSEAAEALVAALGASLRTLNLDHCSQLRDDVVEAAAEHCGGLQRLSLHGMAHISADTLQVVGAACGRLQYLNLAWCQQVGNAELAAIGDGCPELEEVELWQCKKLSDDAVGEFAAQCFRLRRLNLRGCTQVGDGALASVADFCSDLRELVLEGCSAVTDVGLERVLSSCRNLRLINASLCSRVSDAAFTDAPPSLREVALAGTSITDKTMLHLASDGRADELNELNLRFCQRVTDLGLMTVLAAATKLTRLVIEFAPGISDAAAAAAPQSLRDARGVRGGEGAWEELHPQPSGSQAGGRARRPMRGGGLLRPASAGDAIGRGAPLGTPAFDLSPRIAEGASRGAAGKGDGRGALGALQVPQRPPVLGSLRVPRRAAPDPMPMQAGAVLGGAGGARGAAFTTEPKRAVLAPRGLLGEVGRRHSSLR